MTVDVSNRRYMGMCRRQAQLRLCYFDHTQSGQVLSKRRKIAFRIRLTGSRINAMSEQVGNVDGNNASNC